ncbi:calponin transgelin [Vairimorpha necatrix]|uniref:Calponin transgelin n=1 Tax=Vairimorpha necatrix TaxID=6039 RepID=A0AAX4JFS3_9MICR
MDEILNWISLILGDDFSNLSFASALKDGTVLCRLLNKTCGYNIIYKKSPQLFVQRENICAFINGLKKYGILEYELFQTVDLFEEKNLKQVSISLYALSRQLQVKKEFPGPFIGPKLAEKQKIEFSQAVLDKGKYGFNLQIGYDPLYEKITDEEFKKSTL